jgi:hypothetical protein
MSYSSQECNISMDMKKEEKRREREREGKRRGYSSHVQD